VHLPQVSGYGLINAAAFWIAMAVALRRARPGGLEPEFVFKMGVLATLAGIAGGKLGYVSQNPDAPYWGLDRGFILAGGLVGALSAAIFYSLARGKNLLVVGDVANPSIILGIGIGRIGCTLSGCCYGAPADLPLGLDRHPTQLYEAAACFAIFGVLSWIFWSRRRIGLVPCWCYMLYPAARFAIEFLRDDPGRSGHSWAGLTFTQWVCLWGFAMAATGLWTLLRTEASPTRATAGTGGPGCSSA
jgi:phosphatidylglycerol:prolipoprotein diacylglycerol transferase